MIQRLPEDYFTNASKLLYVFHINFVYKLYKLAVRTEQRRNFHSNIQEAGLGKYLIILTPLAVGSGVVAYAK